MSTILVVAPHPDDETLGCGGTLLRHIEKGDSVHWLIVTSIHQKHGFKKEKVEERSGEIDKVSAKYDFVHTHQLNFPTTMLDQIGVSKLVEGISQVFNKIKPEVVYTPYKGDIHTDHHVVFNAVVSCTKWFRYTSVKKVLVYETLSETEFGMNPDDRGFRPNVFVNITPYLNKKIEIMSIFNSEIGEFPFPRSERAIRALAEYRGSSSGCKASEAFMLLKEIID